MRDAIRVDERLRLLGHLVRENATLLDIGTDHAYLPVYLLQNRKIKAAVGADIVPGPLLNAKKNVERYGLTDKIELVLSDGFSAVPKDCATDIVVAGMGGDVTADIIKKCDWIQKDGLRLILQPMTHHEIVRKALYEIGFSIVREECCCQSERAYCAIVAQYCGEKRELNEKEAYLGKLGQAQYDPGATVKFINKLIFFFENKKKGVSDSDTVSKTVIKEILCELSECKEKMIG